MRALLLPFVLLVAGCVQGGPPASDASDGLEEASAPPGPAEAARPPTANGSTTVEPPEEPPSRAWPEPEAALVRPGIRVANGKGGQCTTNFLFTDASSLFIGTAGHCFLENDVGERIELGEEGATGTIAYISFGTMGRERRPSATPGVSETVCANETDAATCSWNDFALVRIDDPFVGLAHPRPLRGPSATAIADSAGPELAASLVAYGNSSLRERLGGHERSGRMVGEEAWTLYGYFTSPAIDGDSGGPVWTEGGAALGAIVFTEWAPKPASTGIVRLDLALAYARLHAGLEVELATVATEGT